MDGRSSFLNFSCPESCVFVMPEIMDSWWDFCHVNSCLSKPKPWCFIPYLSCLSLALDHGRISVGSPWLSSPVLVSVLVFLCLLLFHAHYQVVFSPKLSSYASPTIVDWIPHLGWSSLGRNPLEFPAIHAPTKTFSSSPLFWCPESVSWKQPLKWV